MLKGPMIADIEDSDQALPGSYSLAGPIQRGESGVEMATLLQIIQGMIAGVSILASTLAVLYAASLGGYGINVVIDGQVVEIVAGPQATAATPIPDSAGVQTPVQTDGHDALAAEEEEVEPADSAEDGMTAPPPIPASAVLDYYNLIAPDISAMVISLGRLSYLLENPRIQEEGWRTDVVQLTSMVSDGYEQLLRVRPPAEAVAIHSFLIDTTARCLGVTQSLDGDLTQVPDDLFPVIGQTLRRCTNETKSVVEQVY